MQLLLCYVQRYSTDKQQKLTCLGENAYWSLLTCINGGLAGMVALCAGCNVLHQGAAFALGILGGFTMWWSGNTVRKLSIDDPLGKQLKID